MKVEMIKEWKEENFRLLLFNLNDTDSYGKSRLGYKFYWNDKLLFKGRDYYPSPLYSIDGMGSVYSLLSFLCLREEDVDPYYFKDYTEEQLEFTRHIDCVELQIIAQEGEESQAG